MDGRPHPSDYSEHTWDGFSTGDWVNGQLVVTTTHMKQGVVQRNGSATSPYGKMVEHYFRHGEYMTMSFTVDDPIFLEEPMMRSHTWRLNPNGNMTLGNSFESVEEVAMPPGWVPSYPLGTTHPEFAEQHGLPFGATRGDWRYENQSSVFRNLSALDPSMFAIHRSVAWPRSYFM